MVQNFRIILGAMKNSCIRMVGSRVVKSSFTGEPRGFSSYDNQVNSNSHEHVGNPGRNFLNSGNHDRARGSDYRGNRDNDYSCIDMIA